MFLARQQRRNNDDLSGGGVTIEAWLQKSAEYCASLEPDTYAAWILENQQTMARQRLDTL